MTQGAQPRAGKLPRRERELITRLRQWAKDNRRGSGGKIQIPLDAVWAAFQAIRNRNPEGDFEQAVLAHCLGTLEQHGLIKSFQERTPEKISLPVKIWLLPEALPARVEEPMPRWHHELHWLADQWRRATPKQRAAYIAINLWLKSDPDLFAVPIRERALEIFATFGSETVFPMPEKTFDELKSGILFSDPERLDTVLRTFRPPPPLLTETFPLEEADGHYRRVGTGDVLLVVENSTTWWSIVECLPEHHRLGYVAWGLGGTFRASIRAITAEHRISEIRYFGDLDLSGVRIPLQRVTHVPGTGAATRTTDRGAVQRAPRPRPPPHREGNTSRCTGSRGSGELASRTASRGHNRPSHGRQPARPRVGGLPLSHPEQGLARGHPLMQQGFRHQRPTGKGASSRHRHRVCDQAF
ncbi:hypothetical protein [Streptomyces sp. B21-083]|uniref:hypothetical protein n=1 Tax=Streptomyces sp. B21-083 TaxID=3039410 RepID=UPI002FF14B24